MPRRRRLVRGSRKPTVSTRPYRKRRGYRKLGVQVQSRVHVIKRLGEPGFLQNDSTTSQPTLTATCGGTLQQGTVVNGQFPSTFESPFSMKFQLDSVIDYTDITKMFDRYKIVGVKLKFHYLQNASVPTASSTLPTIHYAYDADDADVPATANEVLTKAYCKTKVLNANRPLSVYYKPRIIKGVQISQFGYGASSERPTWLDCNAPNIPHFGMKMWISDWNGVGHNAIRIQPTYYLALKDTQ